MFLSVLLSRKMHSKTPAQSRHHHTHHHVHLGGAVECGIFHIYCPLCTKPIPCQVTYLEKIKGRPL